jgi:hypothetical protein
MKKTGRGVVIGAAATPKTVTPSKRVTKLCIAAAALLVALSSVAAAQPLPVRKLGPCPAGYASGSVYCTPCPAPRGTPF